MLLVQRWQPPAKSGAMQCLFLQYAWRSLSGLVQRPSDARSTNSLHSNFHSALMVKWMPHSLNFVPWRGTQLACVSHFHLCLRRQLVCQHCTSSLTHNCNQPVQDPYHSEWRHNSSTRYQQSGSQIAMATTLGRTLYGSATDDDRRAAEDGDTDTMGGPKSKMEGTYFNFQRIELDRDKLTQLKNLVVTYNPATLQEQTKTEIAKKLAELFRGQVKKLVYACILTCPWFVAAQSEVSTHARNNLLFVIFVASDEKFFSLATPHERELSETVNEGFLFATDVRHFCSQLYRGNVRSIEALCTPPSSLVLCSQEWLGLVGLVDPIALLKRSFVHSCLGQVVGALVSQKKMRDPLGLRDDTTLTTFCDSCRLLSYAECAGRREPICPWIELDTERDQHEEILALLKQEFQGEVEKERLLELVLAWKERVEGGLGELPKKGPDWSTALGQWLAKTRMDGVTVTQPPALLPSQLDQLVQLLSSLGLPSMDPVNVLVLAEAGSRMYGLSTPTSDTDYIIVYRRPTKVMISAYTLPKEVLDNHGKKWEEEMVAYEARLFSEMLLKGAVNIFELLFAEEVTYASEEWKALVVHKEKFISEEMILGYLGFVQNYMSMIESGKHAGTPREGKIFYHIFHKLLSLEQFTRCKPPVIRCSGEDRDFILRVRNGPLQGEFSKEKLCALAQQRLAIVEELLRKRTTRFPEHGDYRTLQAWLLAVRGVEFARSPQAGCSTSHWE